MTNNTVFTGTELISDKSAVPFEFNKIAGKYDLATFLNQGYTNDLQRSVDRLELKGNEYAADLCCGTGKSTICLLKNLPQGKVLGIDNSKEMLNQAVKKYSDRIRSDRLEFQVQDVMNLNLPDNCLDIIFMAYGIRNMPDYEKCLANLFRILKPGGKICFHEYSLNDKFFYRLYWKIIGYLIVIPFSTLVTGSSRIFKYLVKSVVEFPSPQKFLILMNKAGFINTIRLPITSNKS